MSIALLPIGSYEQHGPILPPDTDIKIAEHMAKELEKWLKGTRVLPTIPFGMAAEHNGFENTISVSLKNAMGYWMDVLKSIAYNNPQTSLVVVINGHGGQQAMLEAICSELNYTTHGTRFMALHVFQPHSRRIAADLFGAFSAHADSVETSVYAAIDPEVGNLSGQTFAIEPAIKHGLRMYPVSNISETGIVSKLPYVIIDPEAGKKVIQSSFEEMINKIAEMTMIIQ